MSQVLRLRPGVHVAEVAEGLSVAGRGRTFVVAHRPELANVWAELFPRLHAGASASALLTGLADAGTGRALLHALAEAGLLLTDLPAGTDLPRTRGYLEACADDPAAAFARWRTTRVRVAADGPAGAATRRALTDLGVDATLIDPGRGDADLVITLDVPEPPAPGLAWVGMLLGGDMALVGPVGVDLAGALAAYRRDTGRTAAPAATSPVVAALAGGLAALAALRWAAGLVDSEAYLIGAERLTVTRLPIAEPAPVERRWPERPGAADAEPTPLPMMEFAHFQARPALIFARPGPRPATSGRGTDGVGTPVRYADRPPIGLGDGTHHLLATVPWPPEMPGPAGDPAAQEHPGAEGQPETSNHPEISADLGASGRDAALGAVRARSVSGATTGERLRALLTGAAGYQRYEPLNTYNAHRAFPSAQCMFPSEVFLHAGGASWHYDVAAHLLRPVGPVPAVASTLADLAGPGLALSVLGRPSHLPGYYRELRWALTLCEAGHLSELALRVARALGFPARLRTDFDDRALLAALGAEPGDGWLPAAMVELSAEPVVLPASDAEWPTSNDPVQAVDRAAWPGPLATDGGDRRTNPAVPPTSRAGMPRLGGGASVELPALAAAPVVSLAELLYERSAGRSVGGFTAAPEVLPVATLSAALAAASTREDWGGGPRLLAVVERVAGLPDGLYEWDAGSLWRHRTGRLLGAVQDAFLYPATVTRADTCNVALLGVVDYPAVVAARGPRGLRTSQLELGAAAQAAGLELAARGAFLRPCRSFDPDGLAAALDLPAGSTVGYLCLIGRSRFTDLMLDLRL